ncbi:MAG: primosomal protein N', partial [Deltaproteobacteria bacterium]
SLRIAYSGSGRALSSLIDKGLVEQKERRVMRDPFGLEPPFYPRPERLTEEQQQVLAALLPAVRRKRYGAFLLHGITGSGKTEVYLRAAEVAIASGRSVLVLVPEIALATQLEGHFYSRFGDLTALVHSGLSAGERFDQWQRIADGSAMVVIGARSAIFAPLAAPGLIVVDEEHDGAYKQEEGLRYQARDLALLRGRMQKATVILGSATPAVTSFMHARQGKFRLLTMNRRIEDRQLPEVSVVDLKKVDRQEGGKPLFSPQLLEGLRRNLELGEQSLLFLNRRGFASLLICRDCGQPVQCRNCQVSLTLHKGLQQLVCHHCGYRIKAAALCEHCKNGNLFTVGFGTERIEEELHNLLPTARIVRLDRDSISKRRDFYAILSRIRQHEVDIVVGTQMIAKGHHFPAVTLVGIVWADAGLGLPDYKAGERTFQLLSQVMGRAGRGDKSGRVIVQTMQPEHYSIQCARDHDYASFLEKELQLRKALSYPPFSRLVNFFFDGVDEQAVQTSAAATGTMLRSLARRHQELAVLGPAPLLKLGGRFRWQCLLCSASVEKLHRCCLAVRASVPAEVRSGKVRLVIDVDPEGML